MRRSIHRRAVVFLLAALVLILVGCKPTLKYSGIEQLHYSVQTQADLEHLDEYPDLKALDLSGSTLDPTTLSAWVAIHPWIDIHYTIAVGNQDVPNDAVELTLSDEPVTFDELMDILSFFPDLTSLTMHNPSLTTDELAALEKQYHNLSIRYTCDLLGQTWDGQVESMDLSGMRSADVSTVCQKLAMFPALTDVELMDNNGNCALTPEDVQLLMQDNPQVRFHYVFTLFGQTVSTADETLTYTDCTIGDAGVSQLRQALQILPACTELKLDNCGIGNDTLMQLQQDYPDIKIVWRVNVDGQNVYTDIEALTLSKSFTNQDIDSLRCLRNLKYLRVRATGLTDYSFVSDMPQLEALLASKTHLTDLTPLAGCTNLQWLELADCEELRDLSPLKDLPNLKYLNISNTAVTDLSVLDHLPLVRLMCLNSSVPADQRTAAEAAHPNALVRFGTGYNYGYGWYYSDYQRTPSEYYEMLCKAFES